MDTPFSLVRRGISTEGVWIWMEMGIGNRGWWLGSNDGPTLKDYRRAQRMVFRFWTGTGGLFAGFACEYLNL